MTKNKAVIQILVVIALVGGSIYLASLLGNKDQGTGAIIKMAHSGASEADMLSAVQQYPNKYALSADDVIQLNKEKVPDAVIKAMLEKKAGTSTPANSTTTASAPSGDLQPGSVIKP